MISLVSRFYEDLRLDKYLVVMPISRFVIEQEFNLGGYYFFPSEQVDINELRIVPNKFINENEKLQVFEGQDLREISSSITGISLDIFRTNTLVTFTTELNWNDFLLQNHKDDIKLISRLSQQAESAMDLIRFNFCRMDLTDTLPGPVGTWDGSEGFSGALLYNLRDNESYIIAGSCLTHLVVKGIGLNLGYNQISVSQQFFNKELAEVGAIARTGLSLFTSVLEANTNTTKFIKAMSLFEYLAYPHDYKNFQKVKKEITCHIAKDKQQYERITNRFFELTGKRDEAGAYIGYRTRIVHLGETLEEILDEKQIEKLLIEINRYLGIVIEDMINHMNYSWEEFISYRDTLKRKLGLKQEGI